MKIAITYPPIENHRGIPQISQNRQFQWFSSPTYIYPVIPAYAATMLKNNKHDVLWLDAIAQNLSYSGWLEKISHFQPDVIMIETKTPVIKYHWQIIDKIKKNLNVKIILVGDHVTALPQESFQNCQVDFVLTGGDYDFLLLNLINYLTKKTKLEPGIFYKNKNKIINTGKFNLAHDLNNLPQIDRKLTKWQLYAYKNGNFKNTPGAYIMSGRDCWWRKNGGCSFCAWTTLYPQYRIRSVNNVLDEIESLINKFQIKEIMDDTGTFPTGKWLREFCQGMIDRGFSKKINFDCNLRFGILSDKDYVFMAKAGFRFLLFGLESASQNTLDKLNKGIKIDQIKNELQIIKNVNQQTNGHLKPHVTCMVGYPWETKEQAQKTVNFTGSLFSKGLINTLQATIVIPYPGTKLFSYCQKNNLLKTANWLDYDMSEGVMKTPLSNKEIKKLTRNIYSSALTPKFILKNILSIRSFKDIIYLAKSFIKLLSHLIDFN